MPQAAAAWLGSAFGAAAWGATGSVAATVAASYVGIGVGYAAAYLGLSTALAKVSESLMGRPRGLGANGAREIVVKSTVAPRGIVYGEITCGGTLVFIGTTGIKNEYLDFVIAVAGHQVEAITDVWFDDTLIPAADIGSGAATGGAVGGTGEYKPRDGHTLAYVYKYLGTSSQTASTVLTATDATGYTDWTADHRLQGCAYVHIRLRRNSKTYETGPPQSFRFRVKGAKVYDPRKDSTNGGSGAHRLYDATTWEWSRNPALCTADYVVGGTLVNDIAEPVRKRGFGASPYDVVWSTVIAAANVCDEDVAIPPEGSPTATHNRYELDGAVYPSDDSPDADCLEQLLTTMLGQVVFTAGAYRLYAGVYDSPQHELTDDELAGPIRYVTAHGRAERYNHVRGTRFDDTQGSQVEFLPRTALAYQTADGRNLYHDIELPCTVDEWRAQRIAQVILRRSREQRTVVWAGKLSCARVAVWETVEVTCGELGLAGKVFRCIDRKIVSGSDQMVVELTLREENAETYSDPYLTDYDSVTVSDDPGPVAGALDDPLGLTASGVPGGILFTITPDPSTPTDAVYEIVEHSAASPVTSAVLRWTGAMLAVAIPFDSSSPVHSGYFWVRARRNAAVSGYYPSGDGVYGVAAEGMSGPPGPPGDDGDPGAPALVIQLTNPHATLVAYADGEVVSFATAEGYLRLYEGGVDITGLAGVTLSVTGAAGCTGTVNTATGVPVAGEPKGYYRVTAMSSDEASLALRASYNGYDYDALFTLTKAMAGYQILATLPTTNLFCGRLVYLTTDGKLWRYDCTRSPVGWTTAVPAIDIEGELTGAQIAADAIVASHFNPGISPVEIFADLPGSGNYVGRMVYRTQDWKLWRYTNNGWSVATDGADITANSITAGQIAAGAVTAAALLIRSGGGALNLDPDMRDASAWFTEGSWDPTFTTVTDGKVGSNVARSPGAQSQFSSRQRIPFDPAKTYRIRGWARTYSGSGGTFYLGVALQDVNGVNISGDGSFWSYGAASGVSLSNTWTAFSGTFGAGTAKPFPANARTMAALVILSYNGGTYHEIQDVRIEEVVPSTLIADGAITTGKIAANAIVAGQIAAGAVTAGTVAADVITANNLQAGIVTAAKMATNTITAASGILADAVIGTAKIQDLAVDTIKIRDGAVTSGFALNYNFNPRATGPATGYNTYQDLVLSGVTIQLLVSEINTAGRVVIWFSSSAKRYGGTGEDVRIRCVRTYDNAIITGNPWMRFTSDEEVYGWTFIDSAPNTSATYYKLQIAQVWNLGSAVNCGSWIDVTMFSAVFKK